MNQVAEQKPPVARWVKAVSAAEPKFRELAALHKVDVDWEAEANFARQIIERNPAIASCRPKSIRDAIINVGAMGLSLNPTKNEVYLVPRGEICTAAISYIGYNNLAIASGVVEHIRAALVHLNDDFTYNGPSSKATHIVTKPFDLTARGEIVGVYAQAKLASGDWLTEIMGMEDIEAVKKSSKARNGPWVTFFGEMARKSVMRRLFKTLPKSGEHKALQHAISISDDQDGLDPSIVAVQPAYTAEEKTEFDAAIKNSYAVGIYCMSRLVDESAWIDLVNSGAKGQKTKIKVLVRSLEASGREICEMAGHQLNEYFSTDDDAGAHEILQDFSSRELECVYMFCLNEPVEWVRGLL